MKLVIAMQWLKSGLLNTSLWVRADGEGAPPLCSCKAGALIDQDACDKTRLTTSPAAKGDVRLISFR